ncbi:ATP-dependent RNA helicase SrmB [Sulfurivirga caldicuralii]|uniref:ATP-dependent RNA helicase SrmB n=1 Tax=Sulfurivirga caldicuralii TaxID=364032 RepID=A0A1N6DN61_9GAMM|nr:DEAD/DEAH box helicase [Sulfurivirga caldicuralii]SIN72114.1 ATP-dependent RNA helicase SrmB [Sulfurivirga caldicuralii]
MTFADLGLDEPLLEALETLHFHRPTPIQAAAIPPLLEGRDVLAGAATGTGKTAAFALPALQKLLDDPKPRNHTRMLFLAPTRELALQIQQTLHQLGRFIPFKAQLLIGGVALQDYDPRHAPMLVSTPGRLLTLLEQDALDLSGVEYLVIDEADRMLDMGLGPDVMTIVETMPQAFQAALFSATLAGEGIETFAEAVLDEPVRIDLNRPDDTSEQVQQSVIHANDTAHKQALTLALLRDPACQRALIFTNTREGAEALTKWLREQGERVGVLHGELPAPKRLERISAFRQGKLKVLVATDLAGRGIDVPDITHVINFDMPRRADQYIHRIGRTGRGQNVGVALSLCRFEELPHLHRIEYRTGQSLPVSSVPRLELKGASFEERLREHKRRLKQKKKAQKKSDTGKGKQKRKTRHRDLKNKGKRTPQKPRQPS